MSTRKLWLARNSFRNTPDLSGPIRQTHGNSAGATAEWTIQYTDGKNSDQPGQKSCPVSNERRCTEPDVLTVLKRKKAVDTSTLRPLEIRRMEVHGFMANGGRRTNTYRFVQYTARDASFPRYAASGDRVTFNYDGQGWVIVRWLTQHTRRGSADPSDTGRQTRPNTRCLDRVTYKLFRSWVPPIKGGVCLDRGYRQCALLEHGAPGHVSTCDLHRRRSCTGGAPYG
ncbi:hypothetical protein EDB83DRAFT_2313235 [Lactarius deliciosus]|nr:hypothetical protein EDB83DRAFT_2313235 [Lactarius deliciosus]